MWDNINLNMKSTVSDSNIRSDTHSCYYNSSVGKGNIFLQLFGWLWGTKTLDESGIGYGIILE